MRLGSPTDGSDAEVRSCPVTRQCRTAVHRPLQTDAKNVAYVVKAVQYRKPESALQL